MINSENDKGRGCGEFPLGVVVFDLDGTLADTSEDIAFSTNFMRKRMGQALLSTEEVLTAVGRGAPFLLQTLLGIDTEDEALNTLLVEFEAHYLAHQGERSRLYPGISDALDDLAHRYDLYVLSNKPMRATRREVEKAGIAGCFKEIWGAGALSGLKPDPVGIIRALQTSGMPRSKAVMVGDLHVDIQAGVNAGVRTCYVTWGFGNLSDAPPVPTAVVNAASELVPAIDEMIL